MADEFRGQPIAQGGIPAQFPSQIGRGEAQVFKPYTNPEARRAELERDRIRANQQEREAKRKDEQAKEHGFEPKVSGIHGAAIPAYMEKVDEFYEYTLENTDRYGESAFEVEWNSKKNDLLLLAEVLKQGHVDQAKKHTEISTKGEGRFEKEWMLKILNDPQYYRDWFSGDINDGTKRYGLDLGGITGKLPDFSPSKWSSNISSKIHGRVTEGGGVWNAEERKWHYGQFYDEGQHIKDVREMAGNEYDADSRAQKYYTDKYGDSAREEAMNDAELTLKPVRTRTKIVSPTKDDSRKSGWFGTYGQAGGFRYAPNLINIAGTEAETRTDKAPWYNFWTPDKEVVVKEGVPSREVVEYPIAAPEETKTVTKKVELLDPADPKGERRINAKVTAFRKDGGKWYVTFKHRTKRGIVDGKMLLSDVKEQINEEYKINEALLEQWEANRLAGDQGGEAPRTVPGSEGGRKRYNAATGNIE